MFRLLGPGLFGVALMLLWIYCIFDVIATDEALVRNLPKFPWLIIVLLVPTVGSVAWLALGRPQFAGWRPGDTSVRPRTGWKGPEDRPEFIERLRAAPLPPPDDTARRLQEWEDDLARRERDLRKGDGSTPA